MKISENTKMLLFRYSNYKHHKFVEEHLAVLNRSGYVWMLKAGKRSSMDKLAAIMKMGGWLVLRAPKADGSTCYIAKFSAIEDTEPEDGVFPDYYNDFLDGDDLYFEEASGQWFKLEMIKELPEKFKTSLVISQSGKHVDDIIDSTRTAVMFIQNEAEIRL